MTQITHTKLDKLNTFELYKHYSALTSSLSLLTQESQELALAELEACAHLRSTKLDGIHYHITKHEKLIEVGQEEKKLLDAALKHHKAEIAALKSILSEVRRRGFADGNKLTGNKYVYHVIPNAQPTVKVSSSIEDWSAQEQSEYSIVEEITTTTICRSSDGSTILRKDEKTKYRCIPNVESILESHTHGKQLPPGVSVKQNYQIRTKRILNDKD
jgi:tRNA G10  N-methylase Trm11